MSFNAAIKNIQNIPKVSAICATGAGAGAITEGHITAGIFSMFIGATVANLSIILGDLNPKTNQVMLFANIVTVAMVVAILGGNRLWRGITESKASEILNGTIKMGAALLCAITAIRILHANSRTATAIQEISPLALTSLGIAAHGIKDLKNGHYSNGSYKLAAGAAGILGSACYIYNAVSQPATLQGLICNGDYKISDSMQTTLLGQEWEIEHMSKHGLRGRFSSSGIDAPGWRSFDWELVESVPGCLSSLEHRRTSNVTQVFYHNRLPWTAIKVGPSVTNDFNNLLALTPMKEEFPNIYFPSTCMYTTRNNLGVMIQEKVFLHFPHIVSSDAANTTEAFLDYEKFIEKTHLQGLNPHRIQHAGFRQDSNDQWQIAITKFDCGEKPCGTT